MGERAFLGYGIAYGCSSDKGEHLPHAPWQQRRLLTTPCFFFFLLVNGSHIYSLKYLAVANRT